MTEPISPKSTHGGARPGAGRPKGTTKRNALVPLSVTIPKGHRKILEARAKAIGHNVSHIIRQLLKSAIAEWKTLKDEAPTGTHKVGKKSTR